MQSLSEKEKESISRRFPFSTFEILSKYRKANKVTLGKHLMPSVGCGTFLVFSLLVDSKKVASVLFD